VDIEGGEMYSGFTRISPEEFDFLLSLVNEDIIAQHRGHYHVTLRNAVIGCNTLAYLNIF